MEDNIINANPTKNFFIEMITRDITLEECILDLIDNSIDNLIKNKDIDIMSFASQTKIKKLDDIPKITINFDSGKFTIRDNCGGITVEEAQNRVFRFGVPQEYKKQNGRGGLSVYGIGMKRAFFKLGKKITLTSTTKEEKFEMTLDVVKWQKNENDWTLKFDKIEKVAHPKDVETGTSIEVTNLNDDVSARFKLNTFHNEITRRISTSYAFFIDLGAEIYLKTKLIKHELPKIGVSKEIQSVRKEIQYDGVNILIIAGLTDREDRIPRGWYVFCNGRMVVEKDQTNLTGWGDDYPQFHVKFNHFVGYVFFWSKNVEALPWTTTKQGVEFESPAYQAALLEMKLHARPILNFLSNMYVDEPSPGDVPERKALDRLESKSIIDISKKESTFRFEKPTIKADQEITIAYKRPHKLLEKIKKTLGKTSMSAKKIGELTFDYFIRKECD